VTVELFRVGVGASEQERRLAVGKERGRRVVRVQILEPTRRQLFPQLSVRRPTDPERVPGTEDVVDEPGLGQLSGLNRTAQVVAALEDADAPPGPGQERSAGQRVDPATDDDRVVVGHERDRMWAEASTSGLEDHRKLTSAAWVVPSRSTSRNSRHDPVQLLSLCHMNV
jgi:hypothetical protein